MISDLIDPMLACACSPCAYQPISAPASSETDMAPLPADKATEFSVDASLPYVPTDSQRHSIANLLLTDRPEPHYEERSGATRLKMGLSTALTHLCMDLGECSSPGCSCNRIEKPLCRTRYRNLVVRRTEQYLRERATHGGKPQLRAVRSSMIKESHTAATHLVCPLARISHTGHPGLRLSSH